jgi:hypothetical protein
MLFFFFSCVIQDQCKKIEGEKTLERKGCMFLCVFLGLCGVEIDDVTNAPVAVGCLAFSLYRTVEALLFFSVFFSLPVSIPCAISFFFFALVSSFVAVGCINDERCV